MRSYSSHVTLLGFLLGQTSVAWATEDKPAASSSSSRPSSEASRAASAAAMTPDEPGRYSEGEYDVQVTVETEEVQEPKAKSPHPVSPAYKGPPPQLSDAEMVRRYRALGLPERQLGKFLQSRMTLTAWYNWEHIGGEGLKTGGTILVVLGAVSVVAGAIFTRLMLDRACQSDNCDDGGAPGFAAGVFGVPAIAAGILELLAGIPMLAVGMARTRRWIPNGELETVPIEELERRRDQSQAKPKTTVSVLPYLTRGGGGFSLALRF